MSRFGLPKKNVRVDQPPKGVKKWVGGCVVKKVIAFCCFVIISPSVKADKKCNEVGQHLAISLRPTELAHVWRTYKERPSDDLRNQLVLHYMSLVTAQAAIIHARIPYTVGIEFDDLVMEGIFGLTEAIDNYNPALGIKFETYSPRRIRGAILDGLRRLDWKPRLVRSRTRITDELAEQLRKSTEAEPSETDLLLALEREYGREKAEKIFKDTDHRGIDSLDRTSNDNLAGAGNKVVSVGDHIADTKTINPAREAANHEFWKDHIGKGLTRAERLILLLYYKENMTMKNIGQTLEMSESRVSQIHSDLIARLRSRMTAEELETAIADFAQNN